MTLATRAILTAALMGGWCCALIAAEEPAAIALRGAVVDAASGDLLPSRLYIRSAQGEYFTAETADPQGTAIAYRKTRASNTASSSETHTTLSAHPFVAQLPPGRYHLLALRGKEYLPAEATIDLNASTSAPVTLKLARWVNMAASGWYSGDTHVHRSMAELPNVIQAEDLNVALPLTYWVTRSDTPPTRGDKNSPAAQGELITVDPTHVIYPMNTEYELFTIRDEQERHTLGAVFALNHRQPLKLGAPPVGPIAAEVRRQGGLLDLDKHSWPWSMMLVPVMKVDLYELSNNHIWRTDFFFRMWGARFPEYMNLEQEAGGLTEKGWIDFTLGNYYTLLNCGFRMRPTAGTASGVHPVPLGFGRVYVHVDGPFTYEKWIEGLDQGRSFVTTGPLLQTYINGELAGRTLAQTEPRQTHRLHGVAQSAEKLAVIEVVSQGEVVRTIKAENRPRPQGGFESPFDETFTVSESTWFAVRCYQPTGDGRQRFAHSAPVHIDVPEKPVRPRRVEVEYLIGRIEDEIQRHRGVLSEEALAEYEQALAVYQGLLKTAR